jgi:alpha-glucoside transport system substrate-binding protein
MRKIRFMAPALVAVLILGACGGDEEGGGEGDGTIIVTSLWGGAEEAAFQVVLDAFQEESGITVEYEPNRTEYESVIRQRINGGNPPDVAIIPSVGFLRQLAGEDSLIPLTDLGVDIDAVESQFPAGALNVGNVGDVQYAFMVKMNSKAAIFYSPERFEALGVSAPAEDWADLTALTDAIKAEGGNPWSVGAASPDSDWTLTDWFEITYLKMHGTEAYDTLFSPEGDWTDPTVQETLDRLFGELLTEENVVGGADGVLATAFVDAIAEVFGTSASAELYCCGGFVGGIATGQDVNPDLAGQEGTAIDWFPFPTVDGEGAGLVTYGGDQIAALVNDTDVQEFMQYMLGQEAAETWAAEGTIIVPNVNVATDVYPTILVQKEAEQINSAEAVRFDGADLLPGGTEFGELLQSVLRGEDAAPLLETFQADVSAAWEE